MLKHVRVSATFDHIAFHIVFFQIRKFRLVQFISNLRTHRDLILMAIFQNFLKPTLSLSD